MRLCVERNGSLLEKHSYLCVPLSQGVVLETFLGPVAEPDHNPEWYTENDASPTGVMWASVINNPNGNATNCQLGGGGAGGACPPKGVRPCRGLAEFPGTGGLTVTTMVSPLGNGTASSPGWWADSLFLPWR